MYKEKFKRLILDEKLGAVIHFFNQESIPHIPSTPVYPSP